MNTPPAGIPEADWLATPASVRFLLLAQQDEIQRLRQENEQLRQQLTALATELAELRKRLDLNSRNSSRPPSSDGPGFKPPVRRNGGSGRKHGGQQGHPGSGPELLPVERCDAVVDHRPEACCRCGTLLQGHDPEPHRHQVIEIQQITAQVIEHRLHRLISPCCGTSTCAVLPADVEISHYGPRLSALVGLLASALPLSISKTQALLDHLLEGSSSNGAIATIRARLSACLRELVEEALQEARQQPVVYVDETGAPNGNAGDEVFSAAVGGNPDGRRGWLWVLITPVLTVFIQGLSRSGFGNHLNQGDQIGRGERSDSGIGQGEGPIPVVHSPCSQFPARLPTLLHTPHPDRAANAPPRPWRSVRASARRTQSTRPGFWLVAVASAAFSTHRGQNRVVV